ncbi:MAG TPA: DUF2239 family protein [Hyphomicrobiales bacterium]|nr:DUF2239 family protein [Hyphomicrobiales bacterium]
MSFSSPRYTAFTGERLLASAPPGELALLVRKALAQADAAPILIFDDHNGRQVDLDLRGTDDEVLARLQPTPPPETEAAPRQAGRPRLGVVAREVTLLPRHWEWLQSQPGGASAALRRLVDTARKQPEGTTQGRREAQQAADRFMLAMLGNQAGYEEAARALYAGDQTRFFALNEAWPADLRDYARRLAAPAFA